MDKITSSPAAASPTEMPAPPTFDEPSLGNTIRECFANLTKGNEAQTERVLDALKSKAPAMDKETTFWNAYKTLSEEYDREFHKKYGTDLDTSLIFAALFFAPSSAFIIQIQPELQQDPNEVTQKLLQILIHNANQSLFSGIDMAEPNSGATTTFTIVQSLLYASLFSTLLATLLPVLGKQWLMHYDTAGSRKFGPFGEQVCSYFGSDLSNFSFNSGSANNLKCPDCETNVNVGAGGAENLAQH
ncbi:hypothetical protein C8J57DRAFT_1242971 [Mycena rebaudengoi]|nr:hypothetical protein C8J57DRAFT_1242971 [Mycena rebaudengoi]